MWNGKRLSVVAVMTVFVVSVFCNTLVADELKPTLIQLNQQEAARWSVTWKQSAKSRLLRYGELVYPQGCQQKGVWHRIVSDSYVQQTVSIDCPTGISGQKIRLEGLQYTQIDALLRIKPLETGVITAHLTPENSEFTVPDNIDLQTGTTFYTYFTLGFEHILAGIDHVFFVVCLALLVAGWRNLVATITSFTIAHSLTLVANTLGWLVLNPSAVEAIIALSIVLLSRELLSTRKTSEASFTKKQPWIVAFLFGLIHGLGFAGALAQIGLPESDFFLALLGFNIGVEVGQLVIVSAVLLFISAHKTFISNNLRIPKLLTASVVGSVSMFWLFERVIT